METNVNGRKFELWVVDRPALAKILKYIDEPNLGKHLKDKTIVVPMSVYNEILMGAILQNKSGFVDLYEVFGGARSANLLTGILKDTNFRSVNDKAEHLTAFYASEDSESRPRIRFMFVPSVMSLHETVEYCIKNLEELTRQICLEEEIGLTELAKWPEIRIAYDMTPKHGRPYPYLWDLG